MTVPAAVMLPPPADAPRASILILVQRNPKLLANCLSALARHLEPGLAEVILLLNNAAPDVVDYVHRHVHGACVVSSPVNLGFAGGCNRAAASARGEFLVLLNDDTEVESNWLQGLIDAADECPDAAAVGSLILNFDGTVQEAGRVLANDGTTIPVGERARLESMAFMYRRQVDYCSGCSLLVRRAIWAQLGGLDEEYYPAYYEDVDLCLRIRAIGRKVIFAPQSRVRHLGTASTDELFRQFIDLRNRRRFADRWKPYLESLEPPPLNSPAAIRRGVAKARGVTQHVIVIDRAIPDGDGDAVHVRRLLAQLAADSAVTFAASEVEPRDPALLGSLGVETLDVPLEAHLSRPDCAYDAVVFVQTADVARLGEMVRHVQPHARIVSAADTLLQRAPESA
jgi:GT2 family glycosyltransferase